MCHRMLSADLHSPHHMARAARTVLVIALLAIGGRLPADDEMKPREPASTPGRPTIHLVPQSHIDVVWLWRFDPETVHRCCKPTFTRATDNLARFPEYTFCQSQVPLYEVTERVYPDLFRKMEQYIREGRWEIVGGMYVEAEGGEPCGESLVRQCVMGKRYFQQRFGVDVTTAWQPDVWSHPWQLPQILRKSGMNSYMFRRGQGAERLFWWQSPDGSRVLACKSPSQEASFDDRLKDLHAVSQRYGVNDVMFEIGGGDHGGGPTENEIEATRRLAQEAGPEVTVTFSTFSRYVNAVLAERPDLPVTNSELAFELHGDLTNCSEIKKSNRECENLLLPSEKWSSIAATLFGLEYPSREIEEAWKKLLFNQFHDIIGGSLIPPAVDDAMGLYRSVRESCAAVSGNALKAIAAHIDTRGNGLPIIVFNPLSWPRTDAVEVDLPFDPAPEDLRMCDSHGAAIPVQILERREEEKKRFVRCVFIANGVSSLGYKTYWASPCNAATADSNAVGMRPPWLLENEFLRIEVDPQSGCVDRIFDKRNKRELLDASRKGNLLIAIEDEGDSEGRFVLGKDTVGSPPGKAREIDSPASVRMIENGPVRSTLRVERAFQKSRFIQDVSLYAGFDRVDFRLTVDWHDVHTMIKLAFPLALEDPEVTYDTAYAAIVRPADGIEYPAQKWVDLSDGRYGVSLLNDARYAHDVQGNTVRMSILRSPTRPARNTDEGVHTLGYALYPHHGAWKKASVMRRGYEFNCPLATRAEKEHEGSLPAERAFLKLAPDNVILEAVKKAYDSAALVLRLWETHGKACTARLTFPVDIQSAFETDLMENRGAELQVSGTTLEVPLAAYDIKTVAVDTRAKS